MSLLVAVLNSVICYITADIYMYNNYTLNCYRYINCVRLLIPNGVFTLMITKGITICILCCLETKVLV